MSKYSRVFWGSQGNPQNIIYTPPGLRFAGSGYVEFPIPLGDTIVAEFYMCCYNYGSRMAISFNSSNNCNLYFTNNTIVLNTGDGANNPFSGVSGYPAVGPFHHYKLIINGSNQTTRLYINGQDMGAANYRSPAGADKVRMSGWFANDGYRWFGDCMDLKIWGDIAQTQLLGSYEFNEKSGSTIWDQSGNGRHGTCVGTQWAVNTSMGGANADAITHRQVWIRNASGNPVRITRNKTVTRRTTTQRYNASTTWQWWGGNTWNTQNTVATQGLWDTQSGGKAYVAMFPNPANWVNSHENATVESVWVYFRRQNSSGLVSNSEGNFAVTSKNTSGGSLIVRNNSGVNYTLPNSTNNATADNSAYLRRDAGWNRGAWKGFDSWGNGRNWFALHGLNNTTLYSSYRYSTLNRRYFGIDSISQGATPYVDVTISYDDITWT